MSAKIWSLFFSLLFTSGCAQNETPITSDQPLAFPGADGFGKFTTGGREGTVYIVSNLNDAGPGSLRDAIKKKEPRIIVFAVSGTIALESQLDINSGNVTIAGQTAPGDGICIRNYPVRINADNVIIRYLRFRLGDEKAVEGDGIYAIRQKNIIIDHCSMSWATDECASFYDNENFTLQWCIISESLNASVHVKGEHGYGGIWGGMGASFHHNLLAHHTSRNPRFCGSRYHKQPEKEIVDFRNNVIYNWKSNSAYGGERGNHNVVNNYYKPGPATTKIKNRIVNPSSPYGKFYVTGNVTEGDEKVTSNNWNGGVQCDDKDSVLLKVPVSVIQVAEQSAEKAFDDVLKKAGASKVRDLVDQRVVEDARTGTAQHGKDKHGIIDSQQDVGGWPELKSVAASMDTDQDGMPDEWEKKSKLNPEDPNDASPFLLSKSYTNIEVYLNSLVE